MEEYNNKLLEIVQNPPSPEEILQMQRDQLMLQALEAGGVDNWEGYDYAVSLLPESYWDNY